MHPFELKLHHALQPQSLHQLDAAGVPRSDLRRSGWRRTSYGWRVPDYVGAPGGPVQRIADAQPLVPPDGALAGWAAAYVHGVEAFDGLDPHTMDRCPLTIALGNPVGRSQHGDVRFVRDRLPAEDVVEVAGLRVTSLVRTAFDLARWAGKIMESVVALDAFLGAELVTMGQISNRCARSTGWRGVPLVRDACFLANGAAESTWESRLRVWAGAELGLRSLLVNRTLVDRRGRFLARPDLFDDEAALAIEFDGADHRARERHSQDNVREELLEDHNVIVARVDSLAMRRNRSELGHRLLAARARGLRRDRQLDRWRLLPP